LDGLRFVCLFGNKQRIHFVSFQHPLRCTSRVRGVRFSALSSVLSFGTGGSHMSNDGINNVKTACGSGSSPCEYTNILLCVQYYHSVRYTIPRHPPPPQIDLCGKRNRGMHESTQASRVTRELLGPAALHRKAEQHRIRVLLGNRFAAEAALVSREIRRIWHWSGVRCCLTDRA